MIDAELRARIERMRQENKQRDEQEGHEARRHRLMNSVDNRAWAVALCLAGFEIIPLILGTKAPAIPNPHPLGSPERGRCKGECGLRGHGFHDASADADWAWWHWTEHPSDGIGVRPPEGVIVLDYDVRRDALKHLAALEAGRDSLPETFTTVSGRGDGGCHKWFGGVEGPVRTTLCPGVDILCRERNFVVFPYSLHPVTLQPYTFREPVADVADAPAWLKQECAKPEPPPSPSRPSRMPVRGAWPRLSPSQTLHRCRGLIDTVANAVDGERRSRLLWAGCRAAEDGFMAEEDDQVWTALAGASGLDPDEIYRTLHGAMAVAGQEG